MLTPYYDRDGIVIYHGDCREILPHVPRADLLCSDPPYGIGEAAGKNKSRGTKNAPAKDFGVSDWDNAPPPPWLLQQAIEKADWAILFGGNYFGLPASPCWLVWDKDNTGDFADCELAWTNLGKAVRMFKWRWNGMLQEHAGIHKEARVHPTQKPVALMKWAVSLAPNVATILDPFMGSETTLVAAKELGLRATGIEREERYCEIAANRLAQGVLNFDESPA